MSTPTPNPPPNPPPNPTGSIGDGPRGREVRITRRFSAPIDDVWAAATEPERMRRWIGFWEGDPATGRVRFTMSAEGEDVPAEEVTTVECDPPRRLVVDTAVREQTWHLRLELSHDGGVTTLVFAQLVGDDDLSSVGPGWEYYLDRLGAVLAGGDVGAVVWDDYYPAMREYYAGLV
jgi:uncharacterized protein YndB with AHSA1/START domain